MGIEGSVGDHGIPGCNGTNGCDGEQGRMGFSGPRGPPGKLGDFGIEGDPGDGGINSPGIKGERGVDGRPGSQVITYLVKRVCKKIILLISLSRDHLGWILKPKDSKGVKVIQEHQDFLVHLASQELRVIQVIQCYQRTPTDSKGLRVMLGIQEDQERNLT